MLDLITVQEGLEAIGREIASGVYDDYYKAKTDFENLEEQKKTMLAIYEMKYEDGKMPQTKVSRLAQADEKYQTWITGLNNARRLMNNALAKVKSVEARMEIYRSLNKYANEAEKF